jgi:hypothetical protein
MPVAIVHIPLGAEPAIRRLPRGVEGESAPRPMAGPAPSRTVEAASVITKGAIMFTKSSIVATAAAVAAAAAVLPLSSAPAAPNQTFTLKSRLDKGTLHRIDNGKRGASAGDVTVLATSLRRDGKPAGRGLYVHTSLDDRYRGVSMIAHLLLPEGTLELQGEALERRAPGLGKPPTEFDLAIVGGTGAYAGATGTVHPVDIGRRQDLHVRLD